MVEVSDVSLNLVATIAADRAISSSSPTDENCPRRNLPVKHLAWPRWRLMVAHPRWRHAKGWVPRQDKSRHNLLMSGWAIN
jgi:hypothetical protein